LTPDPARHCLAAPCVAISGRVIAGVTAEDNGRFFNYDGEALPW
jgi:hypothetical protein